VLQKYDAERDELQRKWQAAMWGAEIKDTSQQHGPSQANGRKQTLTQQDIMRNYAK
jgi:hypothetical protein